MKTNILLLAFLIISLTSTAQKVSPLQYANQLDTAQMRRSLTLLTSPEFAGRKSNEKGATLTADYITSQLKQFNVKEGNNGSYKQNIEAFNGDKATKFFTLNGLNYAENYSYQNKSFNDSIISSDKIVFAGYGLNHPTFNDFDNLDVKDKIVMVLDGDGPKSKFGVKYHNASSIPDLTYLTSQKAKAVLVINQGFSSFSNYGSKRLEFSSKSENQKVPYIQINELLANSLLNSTKKSVKQLIYEYENSGQPSSFEFATNISFNGNTSFKLANINNIVAFIEGSDLKQEYVIITAHYDHIGSSYNDSYYPGADDNASGVASLLEITRVLNEAKKVGNGPRRSIIILFPTAEEDGLCGSEYYVNKPIYPLNKTIACVNIDMIGRNSSSLDTTTINKGYIYALTNSSGINTALFNLSDSINSLTTKISLLSTEGSNYSNNYPRSDHYNFHKANIPSVMFTVGEHNDLHRKTDTVEKINFANMLERSKLVFLSIWEIANTTKVFNQGNQSIAESQYVR